MPHVQIRHAQPLAALLPALSSFQETAAPDVRKVQAAYLAPDGHHLLLEVIVVEQYLRQRFFLLLREEAGNVVVRCHPFCAPQKTDGVKRLIAGIAQLCRAQSPGGEIGHTNLEPYL